MKKKFKTYLPSIFKYFFEFVVVFVGVFLAFWLSEYQTKRDQEQKKKEIYSVIYEELHAFYESGEKENEKGFIQFFQRLDRRSDSLIALKKLPIKMSVYGDYWTIPIINSLVENGLLMDIDIQTFKKVTRFNTVHQNFLRTINDYNDFYDKYITAEYDQGMDHFYKPDSYELKPKYIYLEDALAGIAEFAELLVNVAQELSLEIKKEHLGKNS